MPLPVLEFTLVQFQMFLLVAFRIIAFLYSGPFFGNQSFPPMAKIGLGFFLSMILFGMVGRELIPGAGVGFPQTLGAFVVLAFVETSVGLILGMAASILFSGLQIAGHMIAQQMGIAIATVLDPLSNESLPLISQMYLMFGMLLFVLLNGPNILLGILYQSFQSVPLAGFHFREPMMHFVSENMVNDMLVLSIKVSAPPMVILLVSTVGMGFIARTVPEMNIFIIGFLLRVGVGFFAMLVSVSMFAYVFREYLEKMMGWDLPHLLELMGPPK